jgi:hypothetical protein
MIHSACISRKGGPFVKDVGAVEMVLLSLRCCFYGQSRYSGLESFVVWFLLTLRPVHHEEVWEISNGHTEMGGDSVLPASESQKA